MERVKFINHLLSIVSHASQHLFSLFQLHFFDETIIFFLSFKSNSEATNGISFKNLSNILYLLFYTSKYINISTSIFVT